MDNGPENEAGPVILNGYKYHVNRNAGNMRSKYYRCCNFKSMGCKGTMKQENHAFVEIHEHNHEPNDNMEAKAIFIQELKNAVQARSGSIRDIYDSLSVVHPEGAVQVPYPSITSTLLRCRKKTRPPIPNSFEEIRNILEMEQWQRLQTTASANNFFQGLVRGEDNSQSLIFASVPFLRKVATFANELHADGTFKIVPPAISAYQLFSIHAMAFDHSFAIAYVLMNRKSEAAYTSVITKLKELIPNYAPEIIITDFERALYNSLEAAYPTATVHGCFFHFAQAIYRKARSLRLPQLRNEEIDKIIKKVMALPLVPPGNIPGAIDIIFSNLNAETENILQPFVYYIRNQWVQRVTPEKISVHGLPRRTNNNLESAHRRMYDRMRHHPNVWEFIESLLNMQNASEIDILRVERNMRVTRNPKPKFVAQDKRIQMAWRNLENRRINLREFLENACHFVDGLHGMFNMWVNDGNAEEELVDNRQLLMAEFAQENVAENIEAANNDAPRDVVQDEAGHEQIHGIVRNCVICLIDEAKWACVPCGHKCMCTTCSRNLRLQNIRTCPLCRAEYNIILEIFDV